MARHACAARAPHAHAGKQAALGARRAGRAGAAGRTPRERIRLRGLRSWDLNLEQQPAVVVLAGVKHSLPVNSALASKQRRALLTVFRLVTQGLESREPHFQLRCTHY